MRRVFTEGWWSSVQRGTRVGGTLEGVREVCLLGGGDDGCQGAFGVPKTLVLPDNRVLPDWVHTTQGPIGSGRAEERRVRVNWCRLTRTSLPCHCRGPG